MASYYDNSVLKLKLLTKYSTLSHKIDDQVNKCFMSSKKYDKNDDFLCSL